MTRIQRVNFFFYDDLLMGFRGSFTTLQNQTFYGNGFAIAPVVLGTLANKAYLFQIRGGKGAYGEIWQLDQFAMERVHKKYSEVDAKKISITVREENKDIECFTYVYDAKRFKNKNVKIIDSFRDYALKEKIKAGGVF